MSGYDAGGVFYSDQRAADVQTDESSPRHIQSLLREFIRNYREGDEHVYRDQLSRNYNVKYVFEKKKKKKKKRRLRARTPPNLFYSISASRNPSCLRYSFLSGFVRMYMRSPFFFPISV
jgi:hypothetical protein